MYNDRSKAFYFLNWPRVFAPRLWPIATAPQGAPRRVLDGFTGSTTRVRHAYDLASLVLCHAQFPSRRRCRSIKRPVQCRNIKIKSNRY